MGRTTIRKLYIFSIISHASGLLFSIMGSLFMFFSICSQKIEKDLLTTLLIIGAFVGFLFLVTTTVKSTLLLLKDYSSFRNKKYISVTGTVIGFKKNKDPESNAQINDHPVIKASTGETIVLYVNDQIQLHKTYRFHYLENSKIAEIVEYLQ